MTAAIDVSGLDKTFGAVQALDHLDLTVPEGTVHGLLGPNGAGKTTAVRILSTLIEPDGGRAAVFGIDVGKDPRRVRSMIGLTGQYAAVDEILTGRENLHMIGRLFRLSRPDARARASELLGRFELEDAADRRVRTYSGGMRRRLDVAASLISRPRLIFLDEPTTGLDPRSRIEVWQSVRRLVDEGTTVLLTTQYLDEADQLADSLSVIDHGRVIVGGTPDELKAQVGQDWVGITVIDDTAVDRTTTLLGSALGTDPIADAERLRVDAPLPDGSTLADILKLLNDADIAVGDVTVRRPTLDDVFLTVTGRTSEPTAHEPTHGKDERP